MNKKLLSFLLLLTMIMFIGIDVKAGCGDNSSASCGDAGCSSKTTYTSCNNSTSDDNGVKCCTWTDPTCTNDQYLSNHVCVNKKECCLNGETVKRNSCDSKKGEGDGKCGSHTLSFTNTIEKLSHGKSHTYEVSVPEGREAWTLTVTSNEGFVSQTGHTIKAVNTSNKCVTVTLTSSKDGDDAYSYTSGTTKVTIYPEWNYQGFKKMSDLTDDCEKKYGITEEDADARGLNVYRIKCAASGDVCKCDVYTRGCGSGSSPTPKCYIDNDGFMRWGVYSYSKRACLDPNDNNKYVVCSGNNTKEVPKDKCYNGYSCSTKEPNGSKGSTTCNGLGDNHGTYKKTCKVSNVFENNTAKTKYFYEIECNEGIYTEFRGPAYDWSLETSQNSYLYPATGFKYTLGATSRLYCTGKFHNDMYKKYLKYIKDYSSQLAALSTDQSEEEQRLYKTKVTDFSTLVAKSYISWDPNYTFEPEVTLTDLVAKKNNEQPYTVKLVRNNATKDVKKNTWVCGELIKDTKVKLNSNYELDFGSRGHANFTYDKKQRVEKIVPEACLNTKTGAITYGGSCAKSNSLGAQFFISSDRNVIDELRKKKKPYDYIVEISEMGFSSDENTKTHYASNGTKCRLELLDNQIIYRHVDPKDPFLKGSKHVIGINWKNKKYDFTKIIKPETWSETSQYKTIRLTPDVNRQIKSLTYDDTASVYYVLGCKDSSNSIICRLVKNAKR